MANLFVLDAVVSALENGATTSLVDREVQQIIEIAKKAQQKLLKKHDKHISALTPLTI